MTSPSRILSRWPEHKIAQLRALKASGATAQQAATELGISRNSVIGKLYRLGIRLGRPPGIRPGSTLSLHHRTQISAGMKGFHNNHTGHS